MWEQVRTDGTRKLKRIAIPTNFLNKSQETLENQNNSYGDENENQEINADDQNKLVEHEKKLEELTKKLEIENKNLQQANETINTYKRHFDKLERGRLQLRATNKRLCNENGRLKKKNEQFLKALKKMLNDDQLSSLTRTSTHGLEWSNETIKKALRLRLSCGSAGYEELRNQNIPLPSARTLRNKHGDIDFNEVISIPDCSTNELKIDDVEMYLLYYNAGNILSKIEKYNAVCDDCLNSAGSKHHKPSTKYADLTFRKRFRAKTLFFVTDDVFEFFSKMELFFRQHFQHFQQSSNFRYSLIKFLEQKFNLIPCSSLKNCHKIKNKIVSRFIRFRFRISNTKKQIKKSKTQ